MFCYDPMPRAAWFSDLLSDPEQPRNCTYAMAPPIRPPAPIQGCSGSYLAPSRLLLSYCPPVRPPAPILGRSGSHPAPCRPPSPHHPPVHPPIPIQGCSRVAELVRRSFMAAPPLASSAAPAHAHGAAPVPVRVTYSAPAPPTAVVRVAPILLCGPSPCACPRRRPRSRACPRRRAHSPA